MTLPNLRLRLMSEAVCIRCSQHGYVHDKSQLCLGCLNLALLIYAKRRLKEERKSDGTLRPH